MQVTSDSFQPDGPIPSEFAFGKMHPEDHFELSDNRNPHVAWGGAPEGTRSFAVLCIDSTAPTSGEDVNQEGRTVSKDLPRADFVHWVLVDVPSHVNEIAAGSCSDGVTPGGKQDPPGPAGSRQGVTDYTAWFAGDPAMGGTYYGYDGPAPPWNDELAHHYRFEVLALDVERLDLPEDFQLADVRAAAEGHVLASGSVVGTYTLNPELA
ncbi:MAG: YbhB/YbcL family Raf kinase inhibitor-like protein [Planctomycetota bacterium]